jgi:hypothetical protein
MQSPTHSYAGSWTPELSIQAWIEACIDDKLHDAHPLIVDDDAHIDAIMSSDTFSTPNKRRQGGADQDDEATPRPPVTFGMHVLVPYHRSVLALLTRFR